MQVCANLSMFLRVNFHYNHFTVTLCYTLERLDDNRMHASTHTTIPDNETRLYMSFKSKTK